MYPYLDRDEIARLSSASLSVEQIAHRLGCHRGSVIRIRRELGIGHPRLTVEDVHTRWERVADLTRRGVAAGDIAHQLGLSTGTVFRIRRRLLVARPAHRRFTPDELGLAEKMLADGASLAEVARTLGRDPSTLCKRFKGRGWTPRQVGEFGAMRRRSPDLKLNP